MEIEMHALTEEAATEVEPVIARNGGAVYVFSISRVALVGICSVLLLFGVSFIVLLAFTEPTSSVRGSNLQKSNSPTNAPTKPAVSPNTTETSTESSTESSTERCTEPALNCTLCPALSPTPAPDCALCSTLPPTPPSTTICPTITPCPTSPAFDSSTLDYTRPFRINYFLSTITFYANYAGDNPFVHDFQLLSTKDFQVIFGVSFFHDSYNQHTLELYGPPSQQRANKGFLPIVGGDFSLAISVTTQYWKMNFTQNGKTVNYSYPISPVALPTQVNAVGLRKNHFTKAKITLRGIALAESNFDFADQYSAYIPTGTFAARSIINVSLTWIYGSKLGYDLLLTDQSFLYEKIPFLISFHMGQGGNSGLMFNWHDSDWMKIPFFDKTFTLVNGLFFVHIVSDARFFYVLITQGNNTSNYTFPMSYSISNANCVMLYNSDSRYPNNGKMVINSVNVNTW